MAHDLTAALASAGHEVELVSAHADALLSPERGAPRAETLLPAQRPPPEGIIVDLDGHEVEERLLQRWRFDYGPAMILLSRHAAARSPASLVKATAIRRTPSAWTWPHAKKAGP